MPVPKILGQFLVALICLTCAGAATARRGGPDATANASLGVAFGDPSAVDLKLWTGEGSGFDLGFGLRRFSERFGFYGEYELGLADFRFGPSVKGIFYLGVGGAVSLRHHKDDMSLALIVPVGVDLRFRAPLEVFVEARPGIELLDHNGFGIGGQLGVRYVF